MTIRRIPGLLSIRASKTPFLASNRCTARWQSSGPARPTSNAPTAAKPYYVTTPIFYVNAVPHIGHLFSGVLADVLARYARLKDPTRRVELCTGTDEHGLKIQRAAEEKGIAPRPFCDGISERFRDLANAASLSHTRFIRTTEPEHYHAVDHLWRELLRRGWIYKGTHAGWYSVSDEAFYAENQVTDGVHNGAAVKVSKETGSAVEWLEEESYKFKLSAFREPLITWMEANPKSIVPAERRKEVFSQLSSRNADGDYIHPLEDLSVSRPRSRLTWGIPVPDDPQHTIYVWVDALTNYLTAVGYPDKPIDAWPADVQVIGKDIVRFHAIYWPAMLLALDIPPPRTLLTHAHWTLDRQKMSKSRGNVADPFEALRLYGVAAVRYYLMRNAAISADSDWSEEQIRKHYRRDLQGLLGNLLIRMMAPKITGKLPESYSYRLLENGSLAVTDLPDLPRTDENASIRDVFWGKEDGALARFKTKMDDLEVNKAVEVALEVVEKANHFFSITEPWRSDDPKLILEAHLYAHQALHLAAVLLQPVMPETSAEILAWLGIPEESRTWKYVETSFGEGVGSGSEWTVVSTKPATGAPAPPLFPKLDLTFTT